MKKAILTLFVLFEIYLCLPLNAQNNVELILPTSHNMNITAAEFSRDGKYILTASWDKTAIIWDAKSGRKIHHLTGHSYQIYDAEWSPDGKKVLTASGDNSVKIWDAATGKLIKTLEGHSNTVCSAHWSSDCSKIITGSWDESAKVWDVETGNVIHTLGGHYHYVTSAFWSPDEQKIVTVNYNACSSVWDANTGEKLYLLDSYYQVKDAKFSPDGKMILTADQDSTIKIFNSESGDLIHILSGHSSRITSISWSPLGKEIISSSADGSTKIWNARSGKLLYSFNNFNTVVNSACWSQNGRLIGTVSGSSNVKIWNTETKEIIREFNDISEEKKEIIWSPSGNKLLIVNGHIAELYNVDTGQIIFSLVGHTTHVGFAKWSPNEDIIVSGSDNCSRFWDAKTCRLIHADNSHTEGIDYLDWSPNGQMIVSSDSKSAKLFDSGTHTLLHEFDLATTRAVETAWSPDNKRFAKSYNDTLIKIWDAESGKLIQSLKGHKNIVDFLEFSPDGKKIVTASFDKTAKVWDVFSGQLLHNFDDYTGWVVFASWSPDGKKIATASWDQTVKIYDAENGNILHNLQAHSGNVETAYWSPDGKKLLTAAYDGTVIIWDVKTGTVIKTFTKTDKFQNTGYFKAHWSKDGEKIVVPAKDALDILYSESGQLHKRYELGTFRYQDISFKNNQAISCDNSLIKLTDLANGKESVVFTAIDSSDYFIKTPDNFYFSTKNALSHISFKINNKLYGFEQFDLKYNRPDIVLERLGNTNKELIDAYHKAYLKRLKKMGFKEEDLKGDFHIPESKIKNFEYLPVITDSLKIGLNLHFKDTKYKLDRIDIWANDVPVYGMTGISLRDKNVQDYEASLNVHLVDGENKIQVSVLNQAGAESYKETAYVNYTPKKEIKPSLHIVTIGVSNYQKPGWNLKYAVKDGRDLINFFKSKKSGIWENIYVDSLFNENATIEKIKAVKKKLLNTKIGDQVILFVSGHGLLDDKLDFYFASHNMDFKKPAKHGIAYDLLENLLDSIPARKKLMLIDACHSGETDKDDIAAITEKESSVEGGKGKLVLGSKGGNTKSTRKRQKTGLKNSFELMQQLFADLSRSSGAVVLSAAAGDSYALESAEWNNGAFTYSLLSGLKSGKADTNGDGEVSVTELKGYVIDKVVEITNGRQKPTVRNDNLEFDFRVW